MADRHDILSVSVAVVEKAGAARNILVITGSLVMVTPGAAAALLQCHGKLGISKLHLSNILDK